jgi:hypothetical protein
MADMSKRKKGAFSASRSRSASRAAVVCLPRGEHSCYRASRAENPSRPAPARTMAKPTPLKDALKALEAKEEMPKEEMENVKLYGFMPPISKLDASLSTLKKCKKLSLSTNTIDKITSVSGMDSLEILSLGRNNIKKIEGLDGVADTLKELWISYNNIEKLAGVEKLKALEVLFMCVPTAATPATPRMHARMAPVARATWRPRKADHVRRREPWLAEIGGGAGG